MILCNGKGTQDQRDARGDKYMNINGERVKKIVGRRGMREERCIYIDSGTMRKEKKRIKLRQVVYTKNASMNYAEKCMSSEKTSVRNTEGTNSSADSKKGMRAIGERERQSDRGEKVEEPKAVTPSVSAVARLTLRAKSAVE